MAGVLTTESMVACGHPPGRVQTSSTAKLTVNGNAVLLKSNIDLQAVSGCPTPPAADPSGTPTAGPCTVVTASPLPSPPTAPGITAGEATKLTAGGMPVMLDTLAGSTNGMVSKVSPLPLPAATAVQTKLTAI